MARNAAVSSKVLVPARVLKPARTHEPRERTW